MGGWIKLHRKMLDWEWYNDVNTKVVFLHLILTANNTDSKYRGQDIKRGELVTSYSQLSEQLGLSVKSVRTAIEHLLDGQTIGKRNGKPIGINGMIITICNYDVYNRNDLKEGKRNGKPIGTQRANEGQTPEEKVSPIPPLKEDIQELKNPPIIPPGGYGNFDFGFVEGSFIKPFFDWLEYKKERGDRYKSYKSIKAAYNHLVNLSKGNPFDATAIVEQSIANNWQGLFELKTNSYASNRKDQQQINDEQRNIAASVVAKLIAENRPVN